MGKDGRQYVWRNVAVEIAPGRFSRDHWVQELWHERDHHQPKRSSEGTLRTKAEQPVKKGPYAGFKYKPENCPPTKGSYELVRCEPVPNSRMFRVVAVCRGMHCGGAERRWSAYLWCQPQSKVQTCGKCTYEGRKARRAEARAKLHAAGLRIYEQRVRRTS